MPLTRHFYEIDEVISSLQICLRDKEDEALFWLWELIMSKEEKYADWALNDAWLCWGGGVDPESLNEKDWVERCTRVQHAIAVSKKENAMTVIAKITAPTLPIHSNRTDMAEEFAASLKPRVVGAATFWLNLDDACRRRNKVAAAWFICGAQATFPAEAIWLSLTLISPNPLIQMLKSRAAGESDQQLFQIAAIFILCGKPNKLEEKANPETNRERWAAWLSVVGRRKARVYAIPSDALHSGTTRGGLDRKYTNIEDIRDPVILLSDGCTFWQEAIKKHGITINDDRDTICFPSDDVSELFHEEYFPDDIPDEWSTADQQKSHGRGHLIMP
jgi:hypothetical protein